MVLGDPDFPAFAEGEAARHNDAIWVSLVPDNVWEPGISNWREYFQPDGGSGPLYPEWIQPSGAGDAYGIGERVSYSSENFPEYPYRESKIDANTTVPGEDGDFHRFWQPLEDTGTPVET